AAVGALRWQKLARYAAERGWGLDVITLDPACLARTDPSRTEDLPAGVRIYGIPARHVWVERVVELIWRVLDPARRLRGWTGPPDALARAARPHPESLARDAMRWRPRGPRDFARGYFASLEYARTWRWARAAARRAMQVIEAGVHRAVISCGPPHMAHEAERPRAGSRRCRTAATRRTCDPHNRGDALSSRMPGPFISTALRARCFARPRSSSPSADSRCATSDLNSWDTCERSTACRSSRS